MLKRVILILLFSTLCVEATSAQRDAELDRLQEKIDRHLESKMVEWKHRQIDPIKGSEGVTVSLWFSSNRNVKISIVRYESPKMARDVFEESAKYHNEREAMKGFGDDAYSWGYELSNITFRRGPYLVYLSAHAAVESDPDARRLTPEQRFARERSEVKRWSREFAKHVSNAVDSP